MLLTAPSLWSLNLTAAGKLLVTFGGMSLLLFGGGYVFIPLIQQIVVDDYGWVSRQEFIDAIALGQVTPGPILISAAFIGYKVSGLLGAAAATVGIFTPPAVVMIVSSHFLDRIRQSAAHSGGSARHPLCGYRHDRSLGADGGEDGADRPWSRCSSLSLRSSHCSDSRLRRP